MKITKKLLFLFVGIVIVNNFAAVVPAEQFKEPVVAIYIVDKNGNDSLAGAGCLITKDGHILTAKHVLRDRHGPYARVRLKFYNCDQKYPAKVIRADPYFDIALLKIRDNKLPDPVLFGDSINIKGGSELWIIGHPLREGHQDLFIEENMSLQSAHHGLFITTGTLRPGNSGGPAFNDKGELIGVVVRRSLTANESYVLPIHYAQDLLLAVGINPVLGEQANYRPHLFRLKGTVNLLKESLRNYQQALDYLLTDLEWSVTCQVPEILDPTNKKPVRIRELAICYKKKFDDQIKPDDTLTVIVTPIFKEGYKKNLPPIQRVALASIEATFTEKFASLNSIKIKDLDSELIEELAKFRVRHRESLELNQIESLKVEVCPSFSSANLNTMTPHPPFEDKVLYPPIKE